VYSGVGIEFIGMFTKFWKAVASIIMSVCPRGTIWSPQDGLLQKFVLVVFFLTAMWQENSNLVKTGQM